MEMFLVGLGSSRRHVHKYPKIAGFVKLMYCHNQTIIDGQREVWTLNKNVPTLGCLSFHVIGIQKFMQLFNRFFEEILFSDIIFLSFLSVLQGKFCRTIFKAHFSKRKILLNSQAFNCLSKNCIPANPFL